MISPGRSNGYLPAGAFSRTERIVIDDAGFYFKTRSHELVGPFETEAHANYELAMFINVKT